jgi:hypothetical protein
MAHLLLGEKDLHRHRIGFETQRASSFMKRIKPQNYSEKQFEPER